MNLLVSQKREDVFVDKMRSSRGQRGKDPKKVTKSKQIDHRRATKKLAKRPNVECGSLCDGGASSEEFAHGQ